MKGLATLSLLLELRVFTSASPCFVLKPYGSGPAVQNLEDRRSRFGAYTLFLGISVGRLPLVMVFKNAGRLLGTIKSFNLILLSEP
jgi:hypothetical protein